MRVRGVNGSAIRAVRSRPERTESPATGPAPAPVCADVYMRNLFDIVRAIVAADPNQTIANSPEANRRSIAWSVEDSSELYQVNAWGKGYFCVNPAGHLVVRPDMNPQREIDLFD